MLVKYAQSLIRGIPYQLAIGIVCFTLSIVAVLWFSIEQLYERERQDAIEDVMRHNANLARVFEEHTIRTLHVVDGTLLDMKRRFEAEGEAFDLPAFWKRRDINPDILRNGIVTDSAGMVILAATPSPLALLADREHINTHFAADSGQVHIGKPVFSRLSGDWSLPMTRRVNKPDGSLLGVVSIAVNPLYFSDFYQDLDIGHAGLVSLIGLDGFPRARYVNGPVDLAINISSGELFTQFARAPHGSYVTTPLFDGVERIISYRKVRSYPLLVTVGVATSEALATTVDKSRIDRIVTLVLSVAIFAFAAVLVFFAVRARRHQAAIETAAAEMAVAKDIAETSSRFLRDITDNLPVLIAYFDTERRFRFVNKTGEIWYAKAAQDMIGKLYKDVKGGPLSVTSDKLITRLARGPWRREITISFPDGVTRTIDSILVPDKGPGGVLRGYYRLATDVTARKRLDEQLRESQKMEAIGQLTGGIAHDFNNLLMVIAGNLEIMTDSGTLPSTMMPHAKIVLRASQRGAELTRQLLSFARCQSLSPALTDLNAQVGEIGQLLRRTIPESIVIDLRAHSMPVMTMVDAGQLENALLNLALNAKDAMKTGGMLHFSTAIREYQTNDAAGADIIPAGFYAVIDVCDTGSGMSPEVMAKVFDPFFTTKPMGEGTGLGLSMVYGFVRQSGGYVRISSTPGQGTTVRLLFRGCPD